MIIVGGENQHPLMVSYYPATFGKQTQAAVVLNERYASALSRC